MDLTISAVLDGIVLAIMIVALARGCMIGVIREAFSLGSIAAACVAISYGTTPLAKWLTTISREQIPESISPWLAGALIAIATIAVVGTLGRILRRGARAVGLGFADRFAGALLGAAEGILVSLLVVIGASFALGRDHVWIADSYSLRAYDEIRAVLERESIEVPEEIRSAIQRVGSNQRP